MVYFAVEDTDATAARATELGGAVRVEPFDSSAGRIAVVADPQGAAFSIISPSQAIPAE
jgi:predicted enzyme related to lactoylglutathione lyase